MNKIVFILSAYVLFTNCNSNTKANKKEEFSFPAELVNFKAYSQNPVFKGSDSTAWDEKIRERGYILKEEGIYHLWYTGYKKGKDQMMALGYATSPDGMKWTRYAGNPIYDSLWTEDMMVIKKDDTYHMFAEGKEI